MRLPFLGLSLLSLLMMSSAPGANAPANLVEPLSAPIRLSMSADEVIQALGRPRSDNRHFGGGLGFPGLLVIFDPKGKEMWSLTLTGETRLACGVGVGDPLARVKELFPGTATAAGSHEAKSGQYLLSFWIGSGKVERIVIRPAGERFADFAGATRGAARPPTEIGQLVGRWIDPKSGQSFELSADGTYRTPTGGTGKAAPTAEGLLFTGVFAAWNDGRATVTADLRVIEFRWSNKDGSRSYFAFLRAGGSPGPGR